MKDLIDRQALLAKKIRIPIARIVTEDKIIYRDVVFVKDIEELPSAEPQSHWIPVTERLPEEGVEVLCSIDGDLCMTRLTIPKLFCNVVDAWMPLPEPYKPEENK